MSGMTTAKTSSSQNDHIAMAASFTIPATSSNKPNHTSVERQNNKKNDDSDNDPIDTFIPSTAPYEIGKSFLRHLQYGDLSQAVFPSVLLTLVLKTKTTLPTLILFSFF